MFIVCVLKKNNHSIGMNGPDIFMHSEVDGAKGMALRFPVDDDDYLMPSPGPLGQTQYMDLVGNTSMSG